MNTKTIVVLDSDPEVCATLRAMLENEGHMVFATTVPGELLTELSKRHVDVVLTNRVVGSFEREGSLLTMIQLMQPNTAIVSTTSGIGEKESPGLFDAILPKPFTILDVREVVATVTRRR